MATSKLQRYVSQQLSINFGRFTIRENYRPNWLATGNGGWLELDFFIEELNVAIEVQGEQHFSFIPFFHGERDNFEKRKKYDEMKKQRCFEHGVRLYEVVSRMDMVNLIDSLAFKKQPGLSIPISDHALRKHLVDKQGKPLKAPSVKRRARKLLQTVIAYRQSDQQKASAAYEELLSMHLSDDYLQRLSKRLYPNGVPNCPEFLAWLWS